MDTTKPIIICGAGASIPFLNSLYYRNHHGLPIKLETIIKTNYSIGLNHFFKYGSATTFLSFVDSEFYEDNYENLKHVPLLIGKTSPVLKRHQHDITHPNTILLKKSSGYKGKDSFSEGVYSNQLVGIWALTVAIALGFKEIYLLGYDCCEINGKTHFYQGVIDLNKKRELYVNGKKVGEELMHRGLGKKQTKKGERYSTSTYNRTENLNNQWFKPFKDLKDIKIYNVSSESKIDLFEKIDYDSFYLRVWNNHIDQNEAREEIRKFITEKTND
jgi:hypothetical protein